MSTNRITRALTVLSLMAALLGPAQAGYNEAQDVQNTNALPSPTASDSKVNNYRNQEEQINVTARDGLVKVLRTDQKNLVNDYVTAQIPLRHATPRELRKRHASSDGAWRAGRAEVIRDKKTGENFLQVIAPAFMIPYLREAVAKLDVPWLAEYNDGAEDIYLMAMHRFGRVHRRDRLDLRRRRRLHGHRHHQQRHPALR